MRGTRIAAASVMVAVGLIGTVAAPALAGPPTTKPAERLCAHEGGIDFGSHSTGYVCAFVHGTLSESAVKPARKLCENGFKGDFTIVLTPGVGPDIYTCATPLITG